MSHLVWMQGTELESFARVVAALILSHLLPLEGCFPWKEQQGHVDGATQAPRVCGAWAQESCQGRSWAHTGSPSKRWVSIAMEACKKHKSVCKKIRSNSQLRCPICAIHFQNMLLIRNNCLTLHLRPRTLSVCLDLRHCR